MIWVEIVKIVLAFGIGSLLGLERELNRKPLGVRTLSMICVSSTFVTTIGISHYPNESARIIQGVITGIGFLGAGAVIVQQRSITGITTAALTWATAIIGIGIGLGEYVLTLVAVVIMYLILILGRETKHIRRTPSGFDRIRRMK